MTTQQPVAIVTGAARGIGRGIAEQLARDGFAIVINSVSAPDPATGRSRAIELKQQIESAGGRAEACRGDIAEAGDRAALVDFTLERFGRIDLLVNNAGIAPPQRLDILQAAEESFDVVMRTNLRGPYFLTQRVANEMVRLQKAAVIPRGRIVFVSSISAYTSSINRGDYCISKAAISMSAQLWAHRLAEYDIPVIELRPGIIATDMTAGVKEKYDRLIAEGLLPQKRWGTPGDVARAVSAVARGDLDYSTGVSIDVSGGFQIHRL